MEAPHRGLEAFKSFKANSDLTRFVDLCGQLRFQVRWSHLHRVPRTSVLGHMFLVAMLSYLFSLEHGCCPRRKFNNFFTGLFHDLPEVLTRDIIDPVKKSVPGLDGLIKQFEKRAMKEAVYSLIPEEWHSEIKLFTEHEFQNLILRKGKLRRRKFEEINRDYNFNKYNPRDGELIEACDHLTAFVEAYLAIKNGIRSAELEGAKYSLYKKYKGKIVSGIHFGEIYEDFD